MATMPSFSGAGTDAIEAAQRGFAALGAAQELTLKAWMRAATRQAELTRETLADCATAAAGMHLPTGAEDGQEQARRASLAAETWFRTWRSIAEDLRQDLFEAAEMMMSSVALPPLVPPAARPAHKPKSSH